MSFIEVRDQNGNPPPPSGRLNVQLIPKGFDTPQDDRFTDNVGNTAFPGANLVWPNAGGTFTLRVNKANVNPDYSSTELLVADIEAAPVTLVVQKIGVQPSMCPVDHNKDQFTNWFWDMVNRTGIHNVGTPANENLLALKSELEKCGMVWQNQKVYPQDRWRPRIFQAPLSPPNYDSPWYVDCGGYGKPWELTFRY